MRPPMPLMLALLAALAAPLMTTAGDRAREARIAAEIEPMLIEGEGLRLAADGVEFLAIHTPAATASVRGGVVVLHGLGAHPDWVDVVHPLRVGLAEAGWETLAIQLPVAAAGAPRAESLALIPEAGPRIATAVAWLRQRERAPVVVVAHSFGARMAAEWLAGGDRGVDGLVAIGLSVPSGEAGQELLARWQRLPLPLFDLYGAHDLGAVRNSARQRAAVRIGGPAGDRQQEVPGADHFFRGVETILVGRVDGWLRGIAATGNGAR